MHLKCAGFDLVSVMQFSALLISIEELNVYLHLSLSDPLDLIVTVLILTSYIIYKCIDTLPYGYGLNLNLVLTE